MLSNSSLPIFMLALFFQLCCSLSAPHLIPLNTIQPYTLSANSSLIFKISNFASQHPIGTFNIIVVTGISSHFSNLMLTRQKCSEDTEETFSAFGEVSSDQDLTIMSFIANISDNNCFMVEYFHNLEYPRLDFTVKATFSPIETVVIPKSSSIAEFAEGAEKEFVYKSKTRDAELIKITAKDSQGSCQKTNSALNLQVKQMNKDCLESLSERSWLCYVPTQRDFVKFSLYNPEENKSYEISVEEISSQEKAPRLETIITKSSVPGFGSVMKVNLSQAGILKLKAITSGNKPVQITGASSLENLFGILSQRTLDIGLLETISTSNDDIIIQNREENAPWYYFVPEPSTKESLELSSHFIPLAVLQVGTQAGYYIDPAIYEYQHVQLKLTSRQYPEKYQVTLWTQNPAKSMNLYLDINSYDIRPSFYPDQHAYKKRASSMLFSDSEFTFSFVVGSLDTSVYLTIYAQKEGLYVIEVKKAETLSFWTGLIVVTVMLALVSYLLVCIVKICLMRKVDVGFDEFLEWPPISVNNVGSSNMQTGSTESDLEANSSEANSEIDLSDQVEVCNSRSLSKRITMAKSLKRQEKMERLQKSRDKNLSEEETQEINNHEVIEINENKEENRCDICFEAKKTVGFEPCGHRCACVTCAIIIIKRSPKCPICRGEIDEVKIDKNTQSTQEDMEDQK